MEKCTIFIQTQRVSTGFWGTLASIAAALFRGALCVYLRAWRGCECTFWPGYVCRRAIRPGAQKQSAEPTRSGQTNNLCVRALRCTTSKEEKHTQRDKHIMQRMQTNKRQSRFFFLTLVSLCIFLLHTQSHFSPTLHIFHPAQNRLLIHISEENGKEGSRKADLIQPDMGLICQHTAVFRDCNAPTPRDFRRPEREHFKC